MLYLNKRLTNYFRPHIVPTRNRRWQILTYLQGALCFDSSFEICALDDAILPVVLSFLVQSNTKSIKVSLNLDTLQLVFFIPLIANLTKGFGKCRLQFLRYPTFAPKLDRDKK